MTYEGFITILLTALGVMLALLAIVIGVAAIWGYQGIKERATEDAKKAAEEKLKEHIKSPEIKALIEEHIRLRATEVAKEMVQRRIDAPAPEQPADAQNVAAQYPQER